MKIAAAHRRNGFTLDIAIDVPTPGTVALFGRSGCGKTTLANIIAGLIEPESASIEMDGVVLENTRSGQRVPAERRRIGYVFQEAHLLPWRNALNNVALPLELRGVARASRLAAAAQAIERVELTDAITRYPAELSGGMRMRVSLARALVTSPSLLLLDEPFAALDEITRGQLDEHLRRLWSERRMTVIFVTHSIIEATFLAERAVVLTRRPARVIFDHRLDLPEQRNAALRTDAQFSRQMRVLFEALERGDGREA